MGVRLAPFASASVKALKTDRGRYCNLGKERHEEHCREATNAVEARIDHLGRRLIVNEQDASNFPGFPEHLHLKAPPEGPEALLGRQYCASLVGEHYPGNSTYILLHADISQLLPGYSEFGFEYSIAGPATVLLPSLLFLVLFLVILLTSMGYVVGFYRARKRTFGGQLPNLNSPETYSQWAYERNTAILTFMLIFVGLAFFVFGVSGNIELEIPHAKIVSTAPGIVLVLFGYLIWIRRYYPNRNKDNDTIDHDSEKGR